MIIVPIILIGIFIFKDFNVANYSFQLQLISSGLYGILILNTVLVFYDASISSSGLKKVLEEFYQRGKPIRSIRGMDEVLEELNKERKDAIYVVLLAVLSLVFFWAGEILSTIFFLSIGLVFVTMGLGTLLNITDTPKLQPAGLLDYHEPSLFPTKLDNIMTDVVEAFLDPLTLLVFDEYRGAISDELKWTKKSKIPRQTALERATEKIFFLNYLNQQLSEIVSNELMVFELAELLKDPEHIMQYPSFSSEIIQQVFQDMGTGAEGLFKLISKLIVELNENLGRFKQSDIYIDMAIPDVSIGLTKVNLFILLVNLSNDSNFKVGRPIQISISSEGFLPSETIVDLMLDPSEGFQVKSDKLEIANEGGEDVIGCVTELLQIGDALWIQLEPKNLGKKTLIVQILDPEDNRLLFGKNLITDIRFDTVGLARALVGKASAYFGLTFSLLKFILGGAQV